MYFFIFARMSMEERRKIVKKRVKWRHIKEAAQNTLREWGGKHKNKKNCNVYTLRFECSLFWNEEFFFLSLSLSSPALLYIFSAGTFLSIIYTYSYLTSFSTTITQNIQQL